MKQTLRTFVAVEITSAVRSAAEGLIDRLRAVGADVKWVEPQNLHLTLKFLGDVRTSDTAQVCKAVAEGAAEVEPFAIEVRGAGAFPHARRPRTLWVGVGEGETEMVDLHQHVETALAQLGYPKEHRRFHPHLTIGRVRRGGPAVAELGAALDRQRDFAAGRVAVSRLAIFSSRLQRDGPVYEALAHAELGEEA